MIKAIIWDMGGVLISEDNSKLRSAWEKRLHLSPNELMRVVFHHPLAPKLFTGEEHPDKMWQQIGEQFNLSAEDTKQLSIDFWGKPNWHKDVIDYITSLKEQYKLAVLSDAWITTRETVKERINNDLFDIIMFSAEERLRKPGPEIFQHMLSQLDVKPNEAIFVDDRLVNVEGAQKVGIHSTLYTRDVDIQDRINDIITVELKNA